MAEPYFAEFSVCAAWALSQAREAARGVSMRSQVPPALVSRHCFVIVFVCTTAAASPSALNLRGVAPRDVGYYKSGSLLWCRDGSNRFSIDRLNDDFCDCPDGTDEPGTSACTNGRFYCSNQNRMPFWVFSSRVNDGICDCCDGSDEYTGKVQCGSVCVEGGKMPQVVLPSSPARELVVKDKMKSLRVERIENVQTDTRSKAHVVKILEMLELLFVIVALWKIYKWTFRSGIGLRRRLRH